MKKSSAAKALKEHLQEIKLFERSSETHKSLSPTIKPSRPKPNLDDVSISHKSSKSIQLIVPNQVSPKRRTKLTSLDMSNNPDIQPNHNRTENDGRYSPSVSFSPQLESPDISSRKVSLPQIYSPGHKKIMSNSTIQSEMSALMSPGSATSLLMDLNTSDYIRQAESMNLSPNFSKFNKASSLLSRIDAKKSSLSKELFYYPEQREMYNKLQEITAEKYRSEEENEMGIINVSEGSRPEVNLLEGRNAYFRLVCYKKQFPVKVRVDLFLGEFEIRVSKTKKKPDAENYDFMFSTTSFEVDYKNSEGIKYLYFTVTATERLRISLHFSFRASQKPKNESVPTLINYERESLSKKKKKNIYEFFKEDMTEEEVMKLTKVAEKIKEDKMKKHLSMTSNLDITELNTFIAGKYDVMKTEHLVNLVRTREIRLKLNKQNREQQIDEKLKRFLCDTYRDDIRKIKAQWQLEQDEKKQKMMHFQKDFFVTMALGFICKEIRNRRIALDVIKLIKERINLRAQGIQKAVKVFMKRPVLVDNNKDKDHRKPIKLNAAEGKIALNIYKVLNSWALAVKPTKEKRVENVVAKCLEDWILPLKLRAAITRYKDKVSMVQTKWKKRKDNSKWRVDCFNMFWDKYCQSLIEDEKTKTKKPNTELIKKISKEHVAKYAEKYVKTKTKAFIMAISFFLTLQKTSKKVKTEQNLDNKALLTTVSTPSRASPQPLPKLEINPTQDELKSIFDEIVQELKAEQKICE